MTNERINRAVAEELGYRVEKNTFGFYQLKRGDEIFSGEKSCDNHAWGYVPNFCDDHNAAAEMRKAVRPDEQEQFGSLLWSEVENEVPTFCRGVVLVINITPFKQTRAFLRLRGKWREE